MENAESLKGKEFLDFVLNFLRGKNDVPPITDEERRKRRLPKHCVNVLEHKEATKMLELFKSADADDMIYYFNASDGFKTLVDSLEFGNEAIPILSESLAKDQKLREDFQRQKLYEALIDFLYKKNVNAEGKTLDPSVVKEVFNMLESASLNEEVRNNLSEKKKIKDLFLVVIRSIEIDKNRELVASLIQFVSNLCYGTGKFRRMLLTV